MSGPYSQDLRHTDPKMLNPAYQPPMTGKDWQKLGLAASVVTVAAAFVLGAGRTNAESHALNRAFNGLAPTEIKIGAVVPFSPNGFIDSASFKIDQLVTTEFADGVRQVCAAGQATGEGLLLNRQMKSCRPL